MVSPTPSAGETEAPDGKPRRPVHSLPTTCIRATVLFALDALYLNLGVLAALVWAWLVVLALPRALLSPRYEGVRRRRLRNLAVYAVAATAVLAFNGIANELARERANDLIAVIDRFRADTGAYPTRLEDLVPEYLDAVPRAKPTLSFDRFVYLPDPDDPTLLYTDLPPFGRPVYSFARRDWGYID